MPVRNRFLLRVFPLLSLGLLLFRPPPPTPGHSAAVYAQASSGTIAYLRLNEQTGTEIWLIEPDGSNNRRIWAAGQPDANGPVDIPDLDWRPDAAEIAFSSDHEFACSLFAADLYAIRPDGSGYRRITNGPACAALTSYPKGAVSVTVRNLSTRSPVFVYVQGAPEVQSVLVAGGDSATVTFSDVADFGADVLQQAVVIAGDGRWLAPIAEADVQPGQTVHAGTITVSGEGTENFGAYVPSWHSDGTQLGYILTSAGSMYGVPANPAAGDYGENLLNLGNAVASADTMDWGPTPAHADQLLYASYLNGGIYQVTAGSDNTGTQLVPNGVEALIDVQWLPDGSGFLFTRTGNFRTNANINHYAFATGDVTPLTQFTNEFTIDVSVSADGEWIVFERAANLTYTSGDLWVMRSDGSDLRLLVVNGLRPSWSSQAPQLPPTPTPAPPTATLLPGASPTPVTTPDPAGTPAAVQGYLPLVQQ